MRKEGSCYEVIVRANTSVPTLVDHGSREFVADLETVNALEQVIPSSNIWKNSTDGDGYYGLEGLHEQEGSLLIVKMII